MKVAGGLVGIALLSAAHAALAESVLLRPDAENGHDTSPYQFMPSLQRGNYDKLYAFTDPEHTFESFVYFELPPDLVGPGEVVGLALLAIYYGIDLPPPIAGGGGTSDEPGVAECREVLEPWNEETLSWINKPAYGPVVASVENITALGSLLFDVTDVVANWAYGWEPNYGFAITNPTARMLGFFSFEGGDGPEYRPGLLIDVVPGQVPEPDAPEVAALIAFAALLLARSRRRAV